MKCKCGFKFAGGGEIRNCEAFVAENGHSGIICPECNTAYVSGVEVVLEREKPNKGEEIGKAVKFDVEKYEQEKNWWFRQSSDKQRWEIFQRIKKNEELQAENDELGKYKKVVDELCELPDIKAALAKDENET